VNVLLRYCVGEKNAAEIAAGVEAGLREGELAPGERLPAVRSLAGALAVSPATVASAYRLLRQRGLAHGQGRRGTHLAARPAVSSPPVLAPLPPGVVNLRDGNPDPGLLPPLGPAIAAVDPEAILYGGRPDHAPLLALATEQFRADGVIGGRVGVGGGALDVVERALQAHVRPGDRVAVEDPGYPGVLDLVSALGLVAVPVTVDRAGPVPDALAAALRAGAAAVVVTPRAHNPTGAALTEARAAELRAVLGRTPEALVIEDDHAGPVAGTPAVSLAGGPGRPERWAVVRSVSKWLGPDLRVALFCADEVTASRVEGRQRLGAGWVSRILQQIVAARWSAPDTGDLLDRATATYAARRQALVDALAGRGIAAPTPSGLNVWVPVPAEQPVLASLWEAGYAAMAGERFRLASGPGVRVTIARLDPAQAPAVADAVAAAVGGATTTTVTRTA
jgi:DNA-binding transcriptional MocR family regulator